MIAMLDAVGQEIKAGGRVLFSCKNGAHRSAEITALFLCFITGEKPDKVMRHIRAIREMTDFDSAHPGDRHSFDRPLLTPAQFLRSKEADLRAAHDALEPREKLMLNHVITPCEFQAFATVMGVSFPDRGFVSVGVALQLFSFSWLVLA